jgi:folate-binding protein YgfZ
VDAPAGIEAQHRAARERAVVADRSERGRVVVTGKDRTDFLQGMLTQDVKALAPGQALPAALLNAKGHVLALLRVVHRGDHHLLDTEPGLAEKVRAALDRYVITEDVTLTDASATLGHLLVAGPDAPRALAAAGVQGAIALPGSEAGPGALEVFAPAADLPRLARALAGAGAQPIGPEALEVLRVEAAAPRYGVDLDEANLPQEASLEPAISFTKGCYVGQEVVIRIHHQGHVNRRLVALDVEGREPPPRGAPLARDGKDVGRLTSAVWSPGLGRVVALGYVARGHDASGTALSVRAPDGERPAVVAARKWA